MRKLKLQVQMTIDGFISGQNGDMEWMNLNWSDDIKTYVAKLTNDVDTILLGRKLAEGFIPYWTDSFNSTNPEEGADVFVQTPKIVFTKTMETSIWNNTELAKGALIDEVNKLKKQSGKDIIVYGGGTFVSSLIKDNLIDEMHLFVNPSILGAGLPIFQSIQKMRQYQLIDVHTFTCGIVVLSYKPK